MDLELRGCVEMVCGGASALPPKQKFGEYIPCRLVTNWQSSIEHHLWGERAEPSEVGPDGPLSVFLSDRGRTWLSLKCCCHLEEARLSRDHRESPSACKVPADLRWREEYEKAREQGRRGRGARRRPA